MMNLKLNLKIPDPTIKAATIAPASSMNSTRNSPNELAFSTIGRAAEVGLSRANAVGAIAKRVDGVDGILSLGFGSFVDGTVTMFSWFLDRVMFSLNWHALPVNSVGHLENIQKI